MGTDCGIAIEKDGRFKTVMLDRYYVFHGLQPSMTWMSEDELIKYIDESLQYHKEDYEFYREYRHWNYCQHWLAVAMECVRQNRGARFAIYLDYQFDTDKIESYK